MSSRLELVSTVRIPAIGTFSVDAHFKAGETDGVKIGWLGKNFRLEFLGDSKEEAKVAEATLRVHRLIEPSTDASIIAELGGDKKAAVSLGQIWQLLLRQGYGQEGSLLADGYANIFYVAASSVLWAVGYRWGFSCGGWVVLTGPVAYPGEWGAGCRVFSR